MVISPSGKMVRDFKFQRSSRTKLLLFFIFYSPLNLGDCKNVSDLQKVNGACNFNKLDYEVLRFLTLLLC